ncbi:hypothetical protein HK101_007487 [Irineochytrium annulatum]|nr:hypothetical protein HK101_007487 [Irineochytrium annulatum]
MSAGLSREVLKWIQGLNLSYSIRNSKRDLANGFLVAEILSRFFPDVVHMHAYDTGTGTAAKKNNWDLLERAFVRIGIPVPRDYAADVAASKNDAGALVLSIIYTHIVKSGSHGISISREHEDPTDWLMKPPPSRGGGVHLLLDQSPIHDPPLSHLLDPPSPVILPPPPLIPIPIPTPSPALPSTTRAAAKSPLKRGAGKGSYAAQRMNQITQQQGVGSSGAAGGSPSTAAGGAAGGNASVIGKEAILMANPKAAAMLLQGPSGDYGKEFEEHMGKVTEFASVLAGRIVNEI